MIKSIRLFFVLIFSLPLLITAQSIQANWQCTAAIVEYTHVVREFDSPEDTLQGSYDVTVSWPSSANPLYTRTIKTYNIGDTVTVNLVPLINPSLLAAFGVSMNVDLNDDGTFTINEGSTYPTTEAEDCSTYATVPAVSEDGTWTGGSGFTHPDDPNAYSMGWGISLSDVFAQFGAADLAGGTYGVDYGVGTDMENWGMVTVGYDDEAHTTPEDLEIYWEAHDGTASGLGINDDGQLNDFFGVFASPGDTVTINNMRGYAQMLHPEIYANLGWTQEGAAPITAPMIGGSGNIVDPTDPNSFVVDPITGDTLPSGTVLAHNGYLFDPVGNDGAPFSGDEWGAATGYFFTYQFMEAGALFPGVLNAYLGAGAGLQDALAAAADTVAEKYVGAEVSAVIGASVGESLFNEYVACVGSGASEEQCAAIFQKGPTMALVGASQACNYACGVDDSGMDYDPTQGKGRLVFEVDNSCIVDNTTQRVRTFWQNTSLLAGTAGVQIIHNSPYPTVDIYVDGELALDSVEYRASTPLLDLPTNATVGIAPAGGDVIASFPFELEEGNSYVVVASGIVGDEDHPFDLLPSTLDPAAIDTDHFAVKVMHGVTDAPAVDIYANGNLLVENLGYGDFQGYLQVPVGDYTLDITAHGSMESVAAFGAPLATFGGFSGVVYASGFLSPADTDSAFTLILTTPSGYVVELPPAESQLGTDENAPVALKFELIGNYPNPFNPETKIKFSTERDSDVQVTIYSLIGEKVQTIQNGQLNAGNHNLSWYGKDQSGNKVPSGVYFYEVKSDNRTATGKMLLLK